MLVLFAGYGHPARPAVSLALAAVASVGFATLPGHLGCASRMSLHLVVGHLLAPVTGGALVLAVIALLYRPALPPVRR